MLRNWECVCHAGTTVCIRGRSLVYKPGAGSGLVPLSMEVGCVGSERGLGRPPRLLMDPRAEVQATGPDSASVDVYESLPESASVKAHMLAGSVAGILEHSLMFPIDSVKTRMQSLQPDPKAQYRNVFDGLLRIIHTEGAWRPLRGLNAMVVGAGPAHALYFACYEKMKRTLSDAISHGGNSHLANGIAGGTATLLHDAVMTPAEAIKQRMQMFQSPYKGVWDCIRIIRQVEGSRAFYRSYTTQLTMNVPFQAIHFITYEIMQEWLNPMRQYSPSTHVLSGAMAGAVAAAATTPLDVCKTLLNTQENLAVRTLKPNSGHLSGLANAFRTVYQIGGLAAYFKGVHARVIYQMPSTAISWSVYEFFKSVILKKQQQSLSSSL